MQFRCVRIIAAATTNVFKSNCWVHQILVSCSAAGSVFTLRVVDRGTPVKILCPIFTLTVPTDGKPIPLLPLESGPWIMEGGIDIITTLTSGSPVVDVWTNFSTTKLGG